MNAEQFLEQLLIEISISRQAFVSNMKNLGLEDKKFCEWVPLFLGWMELGTPEDCERHYGRIDEHRTARV